MFSLESQNELVLRHSVILSGSCSSEGFEFMISLNDFVEKCCLRYQKGSTFQKSFLPHQSVVSKKMVEALSTPIKVQFFKIESQFSEG